VLSIWPSLFASTCAVTGVAVLVGPYLRQAGVPLPESAAAALVGGSYAVTALFPTGRYTTGLTLLLGAALPLGWPVARCLLVVAGLGLLRGAQVTYAAQVGVRRWVAIQNVAFAAGPVAFEVARARLGVVGIQGLLALLALFALGTRPSLQSQPIDKAPTAAGFGAILALVLFYFAQSQGMSLYSLADENGLPAGLAAAAHGLAVSALVLVIPRRMMRLDLGLLFYAIGFVLLAWHVGRLPIAVSLGLHGLGEAMLLPALLPVLTGSRSTTRWLCAAAGYSVGLLSGGWRFGPTAYFGALAAGFLAAAAASLVVGNRARNT